MKKKQLTEYEKLRNKWYKKLEKDGFEDIEANEDTLKHWSSDKFNRKRSLVNRGARARYEDNVTYYRMAEDFLNTYTFESNIEQVIWEYHINAISARDITELLRKAKVWKTNRTTVWQIIKRLRETMKKMYLVGSHE